MNEPITVESLQNLVKQLNYLIPTECRLSRLSFKNPRVREVWRYELHRAANHEGYLLLLRQQKDSGAVIKVSEPMTKREMHNALKTIYSMRMFMPLGIYDAYLDRLHCNDCMRNCT